ncbi:MAG: hypothetical protein VB042_10345 [Victivallaceae bacterium]|nr:hypothetical protein [Victivallaceae bacterium]
MALHAETLPCGTPVVFPRGAGSEHRAELLQMLGGIDSETGKLLYSVPSSASLPARIEVIGTPIEGKFMLARYGDVAVLRVGSDYAEFMKTRQSGRVFAIFLMLVKCGIAPETGFPRFPVWMADGVLRRIESQEKARNQMRLNVGYYPGVCAVLLKRGNFPLRTVIGEASTLHEAGGAAAEFGDQASMLAVELCRERAAIPLVPGTYRQAATAAPPVRIAGMCPAGKMIVSACDGDDFDKAFLTAFSSLFEPAPADLESLDAALSAAIERRVFTQFNPYPACEQRHRLERFSRFTYFDDKGRRCEADITDLPLLIEKYDSCRFAYNAKARELASLLNGAGPVTYAGIELLLRAFSQVGAAPAEDCRRLLTDSLAGAFNAVARMQRTEDLLAAAELELVPASETYRFSLDSVGKPGSSLPASFQNVLEKAGE